MIFCVERRARVYEIIAKSLFQINVSNPHASLTDKEGDIPNMWQHRWCDWCYYVENTNIFLFSKEGLGRVLGPSKDEDDEIGK